MKRAANEGGRGTGHGDTQPLYTGDFITVIREGHGTGQVVLCGQGPQVTNCMVPGSSGVPLDGLVLLLSVLSVLSGTGLALQMHSLTSS